MTNYAKNEKGYKKIEIDAKAIKRAYEKRKKAKKFPTSISLPEDIVAELKDLAQKKGVPYQTLMRMLIVEGLENLRKSA
jgi:predicted DNA binding CopG/RHH family protein